MSRVFSVPGSALAIVLLLSISLGCTKTADDPQENAGDALKPMKRFVKNGVQYERYEVERKDYKSPPLRVALRNDRANPELVPKFDPTLAHPLPVKGWDVNFSRTMFKLDTPTLKPDYDAALLKLRPHYQAAIGSRRNILPSVNLVDGKAKQFDDGLYAALDLAWFAGHEDTLLGHVELVKRLAENVGPDGEAAAFLAAGLELVDIAVPAADQAAQKKFREEFENSPLQSKPLGFYNWSPELVKCYRFLKFFQRPFFMTDGKFPPISQQLATALHADAALSADYEKAIGFYARLTNPLIALSLLDVTADADPAALIQSQVAAHKHPAVSLFPASTSKEQRLFDRLFPLGFPEGADLMQELIRATQKGDVDLTPGPDSGWYDYQAYALETFVLPGKGDESRKLLLTARYKQRMLDAFAALITKRRETHVRQLAAAGAPGCAPPHRPNPLQQLSPQFRLEPNATYYLRTARAYGFLQAFLYETMGKELLEQITGLREGGSRTTNLDAELQAQIELFYGFYLLAMEDVGLPADLLDDEPVDEELAKTRAIAWLKDFSDDPDLAVDTRVVVPIAVNIPQGTTQLWGTVGVRLARLHVDFDSSFPPSVRPAGSDEDWKRFEGKLQQTTYYIPVDEFISVEIPTLDCPTRTEFRKLCDESADRAQLIEKLQSR